MSVSHSSFHTALFLFSDGNLVYNKYELPWFDDIICLISLGFPSWFPASTGPTDSCLVVYRGQMYITTEF